MDHLWKELKRLSAANRQFRTIDAGADYAEHWLLDLTPREALRKAGVLSEDFWLKDFLENFWRVLADLLRVTQAMTCDRGRETVVRTGEATSLGRKADRIALTGEVRGVPPFEPTPLRAWSRRSRARRLRWS